MDTARLKALTDRLGPEFHNVQFWIEHLADRLEGKNVTPKLDPAKELEERLVNAPSNQFVPSWSRMIAALGGRRLHGLALWERIAAALENDEYDRNAQSSILRALAREVASFTSTISSINSAVAQLPADELTSDVCEFGVLFPTELVSQPDEMSAELHELSIHLRLLWEIAGRSGEVRLRRLDNDSADFFWTVPLSLGSTIASILWGIAQIKEKLASARKLDAEARKLNAEAADILRRQADEDAAKNRHELHERTLETYSGGDAARRNELAQAVTHTLGYIETKIEVGVMFEVRAPNTPSTAKGETQSARDKTIAQIREAGSSLSAFDSKLATPQIPQPDE